jgi:hypothetical protein
MEVGVDGLYAKQAGRLFEGNTHTRKCHATPALASATSSRSMAFCALHAHRMCNHF